MEFITALILGLVIGILAMVIIDVFTDIMSQWGVVNMSDDWRPKGWENPIPVILPIPDNFQEGGAWHKHLLFEAGADAMLEALWKLAKESPTGTFVFDSNTVTIYITKGENNDDNNKTNL